jgi:GNAT superfamily N-acetyltransferase
MLARHSVYHMTDIAASRASIGQASNNGLWRVAIWSMSGPSFAVYTGASMEIVAHGKAQSVSMSESRIQVVQATTSHLEELAALFDGYRQFYGEAPDLDGARAFLAERLERGDSTLLLALLDQDGGSLPAGLAQLYPSFSSTAMRRLWILNDLFVTPQARQHGVGRALLQAAREHAERTQSKGLELMTAHDNHAAQALYESMGWKRDETFYTYTLYF